MALRCFEWKDIPILHRYRDEMIYLNSEFVLKSGTLNIFEAILSSVLPLDSVRTLVSASQAKTHHHANPRPLICQAVYRAGEEHAYLTFMAPESSLDAQHVFTLIDEITRWVGKRGALRLLADVEESHPLFELLRQAGFTVYARQRVWQIVQAGHTKPAEKQPNSYHWQPYQPADRPAVQSLIQNLVPNLVQRVGQPLFNSSKGLVCYHQKELVAFIDLHYGVNGICAYPLIHPDAPEVVSTLPQIMDELAGLSPRLQRPVYALVSHYQHWIESSLVSQGALISISQALMVKHLTSQQKVAQALIPGFDFESTQTHTLAFVSYGEKNYESCTNH